jgi:ATP-dependent helicase HrpB
MSGRRLLMLEPRRLAAQRAARYIAGLLDEQIGETVGFRIRGETRVGPGTRIEVVTEGILTRMLQREPDLPGVAAVLFDEFHERSIHADVGLALALDVQAHLRPDLRILLMSATPDTAGLTALCPGAALVEVPGRSHPVETRYLEFSVSGSIEPAVAAAVRRSLREDEGDILVFLPGQREIRRTEAIICDEGLPDQVRVCMLFGEAQTEQQQAALEPAVAGVRKVILSTSIAETSLTVDGVRVVVDAGLARTARFDPRRGMSGLVTGPVSQASADQRRGRAGRQAPGVCYRLWTRERQEALPPFTSPEILHADLAPLALDLALWGEPTGGGLRFLDPPPPAHLARARALLGDLGALDARGAITDHGRRMADLPLHPRLAHMILHAAARGEGGLACDLAALLEERDLLRGERDVDLALRWDVLREGAAGTDRSVRDRVRAESRRLRSLAGVPSDSAGVERIGPLIAMAYPDRVGRRRTPEGERYQLSGGTGAVIPPWSALRREEYLAIAEVDGVGLEPRVFLAARVDAESIRELFADRLERESEVRWSVTEEAVVARRVERLGSMVLDAKPMVPSGDDVRSVIVDVIRSLGLEILPWTAEARSLRERGTWVARASLAPAGWPDLNDQALLAGLDAWLGPFLGGISRKTQFQRIDVGGALRNLFGPAHLALLDRLAPQALRVPTGRHVVLDYSAEKKPVLAVKLQEMFGQRETPAVGGGKVPVVIHLLSPAGRPLAVTGDLPSFWTNAYPSVRKEMRGRYPKHPWPEDPLEAVPTHRTKRRD